MMFSKRAQSPSTDWGCDDTWWSRKKNLQVKEFYHMCSVLLVHWYITLQNDGQSKPCKQLYSQYEYEYEYALRIF